MKRSLRSILALLLLLGGPAATWAAMEGTPHDLSNDDLGSTEICAFCHVPHSAQPSAAPLWNHADTTQTFQFYGGTSAEATGSSLQCLSCHDGVSFIDAFGGREGSVTLGEKYPGTRAVIGTNLADDHPIAVTYTAAAGRFKDLGGTTTVKLFDGKVECASCHNPHDTEHGHFLRAPNTRSALCLTCHDK